MSLKDVFSGLNQKERDALAFSNRLSGVIGEPTQDMWYSNWYWQTEHYYVFAAHRIWGKDCRYVWQSIPIVCGMVSDGKVYLNQDHSASYDDSPDGWYQRNEGTCSLILPPEKERMRILHELIKTFNKPIIDGQMVNEHGPTWDWDCLYPEPEQDDGPIDNRFEILDL